MLFTISVLKLSRTDYITSQVVYIQFYFENVSMALSKAKYSEIPSDAVVLTESEAVLYQSRILNKWQNSSDV